MQGRGRARSSEVGRPHSALPTLPCFTSDRAKFSFHTSQYCVAASMIIRIDMDSEGNEKNTCIICFTDET